MTCSWNGVDTGDLPTWIGACAAVAAVGVAYLAFIDQRRRADAAEERARQAETASRAEKIARESSSWALLGGAVGLTLSGVLGRLESVGSAETFAFLPGKAHFRDSLSGARKMLRVLKAAELTDHHFSLMVLEFEEVLVNLAPVEFLDHLSPAAQTVLETARHQLQMFFDQAQGQQALRPD